MWPQHHIFLAWPGVIPEHKQEEALNNAGCASPTTPTLKNKQIKKQNQEFHDKLILAGS